MRDPPGLGLEPLSPALAGDFFTTELPEKPSHLVLISRAWRKRCYLLAPMEPHSSTFAWKIPWTEEPGRLQSMGLRRVGHNWATSLSLFTFMHWRRKWKPTPVFLSGESQGRKSWWAAVYGAHRVRHDWSDLAAAAKHHQLCSFGCIHFCCLYESSSFAL